MWLEENPRVAPGEATICRCHSPRLLWQECPSLSTPHRSRRLGPDYSSYLSVFNTKIKPDPYKTGPYSPSPRSGSCETRESNKIISMKLNVPEPVAAYLAAEEAKDAEKLALCFTDDGTVVDEGEDHHGRAAIQQWKQKAKYRYVLLPFTLTRRQTR